MSTDGTLAWVTYLPWVAPPAEAALPEPELPELKPASDQPAETLPEVDQLSDNALNDTTLNDNPANGSAQSDSAQERGAQEHRAQNVSMHALAQRGMSRWELGRFLLSRALDSDTVEAELDRLERIELIDDTALAETFVRTQHERKGLGKVALVAELRRRHIDQSAIDKALLQLSAADEFARAVELAERRALQLRGLDHDTAVRRLTGYLQRKGYSAETVGSVLTGAFPPNLSGVRFRESACWGTRVRQHGKLGWQR